MKPIHHPTIQASSKITITIILQLTYYLAIQTIPITLSTTTITTVTTSSTNLLPVSTIITITVILTISIQSTNQSLTTSSQLTTVQLITVQPAIVQPIIIHLIITNATSISFILLPIVRLLIMATSLDSLDFLIKYYQAIECPTNLGQLNLATIVLQNLSTYDLLDAEYSLFSFLIIPIIQPIDLLSRYFHLYLQHHYPSGSIILTVLSYQHGQVPIICLLLDLDLPHCPGYFQSSNSDSFQTHLNFFPIQVTTTTITIAPVLLIAISEPHFHSIISYRNYFHQYSSTVSLIIQQCQGSFSISILTDLDQYSSLNHHSFSQLLFCQDSTVFYSFYIFTMFSYKTVHQEFHIHHKISMTNY